MRHTYVLSVALTIILLMTACGQKADDSVLKASISTPLDSEAVALYKKQCISCHANDLNGRVGPGLIDIGSRFTQDQLVTIIEEGTGKGMPSYSKRLEQQEIEALAQWLAKMN